VVVLVIRGLTSATVCAQRCAMVFQRDGVAAATPGVTELTATAEVTP